MSPTAATGTVRITDKGKVVKTVTLTGGKASVKLKLKKGKHKLAASYAGGASYLPSASGTLTIRVVR
ncbi:Bacterial Ig-like domain (group 3) [compost metagenome]